MIQAGILVASRGSHLFAGSVLTNAIRNYRSAKERIVHPDKLQYAKLSPLEMGILQNTDGNFVFDALQNSKFFARLNSEAKLRQYVWVSEHKVTASDVKTIFEELIKKGQSVHINTGTHGDKEGKNVHDSQDDLYANSGFLKEDLDLVWKRENASFQVVSKDSRPTYPENANHVIDAWCHSANKSIHKIREEAEKAFQHTSYNTTVGDNQGGNQSVTFNINTGTITNNTGGSVNDLSGVKKK